MFYNFLSHLASEWTFFNVFRYITFRSMAALMTALLVSIILGPRFIGWLRRLKCGQYIHEDVAAHACKAGTPTMGGLLMLFSLSVSLLLWSDLTNSYIWQAFFVFVGFGAVGFWDDITKLRHHKNRGISGKAKMAGQLAVACVAMLLLFVNPDYSSKLTIPFFKEVTFDLGWFYLPFGVFVMVAASNAVNLTDGLDGLAIGPAIVACIVFSIFIYITGNARFASYLLVPYMPGVGEVTIFCAALVGSGLGFLWFNAYPAQVFMGDVGALALGGALGTVAVIVRQEIVLAIMGGIFVVEALSVMLQVSYFKYTRKRTGQGKRLFKMAPLHHHFEKSGWKETQVVVRFWIITMLLCLVGLSTLKLR